ncbi:hypothetical protein FS842_005221, partial [Serendipita sp. 407]
MFPDPLCSLLGLDFGMEPDGFNPDCYGMVHDDSSSSDLFSSSSPLASLSSSSSSKHLDSCDIIAIMDPEPMVSIGVIPVTDISKPAKEANTLPVTMDQCQPVLGGELELELDLEWLMRIGAKPTGEPLPPIETSSMPFWDLPPAVGMHPPIPPSSLSDGINISPTHEGSSSDSKISPVTLSTSISDISIPDSDNAGVVNKEQHGNDHVHELEKGLIKHGAVDKVEEMQRVQQLVNYHESASADTAIGDLPPKLFAPFFKTFVKGSCHLEDKKKKWGCLFCGHSIENRTQMVQHVMGVHFKYKPFKCDN